jgi:hypothetical protein
MGARRAPEIPKRKKCAAVTISDEEWEEEGEQLSHFLNDREGETWTLDDLLADLRQEDFSEERLRRFRLSVRSDVSYSTPDCEVVLEL